MKIKILPSAFGHGVDYQYLTTFLVDDSVAIDAGCIGVYGDPAIQSRVSHVFVTHSHADHIGTLPIFVETVCMGRSGSVTIYGHPDTLHALSNDVFNDRVWPDYSRFSKDEQPNFHFVPLESEKTVDVEGLRITPVQVNHKITTFGYVVDSGGRTAVFGGDSGPTERIWQVAGQRSDVRAAFVETSFPDELGEQAAGSGHLTPSLLAAEIEKLSGDAGIIVTHIKPAYRARIIEQIAMLGNPRVTIGTPDGEYVI